MIALLLIPILICGITILKGHPYESLKIGTYKGWPIYLYAIKNGTIFIFFIFIISDLLIPLFSEFSKFYSLSPEDRKQFSLFTFISLESKELSPLNIISVFLYNINHTENIISIFSLNDEEKLTLKFLSLSFLSIALSTLLVKLKLASKKILSKTTPRLASFFQERDNAKIASIYKEKSPSDFLLLQITDTFVEQDIFISQISNNISHYEKYRTFSKNINTLKDKAILYANMNKTINFFIRIYDRFCDTEENRLREIEDTYTKYKKMYKSLLEQEYIAYQEMCYQVRVEAEDRTYALITLNSRKIYIGVPIATGKPDEEGVENKEVLILPSFSGVRDEKKLFIELTNMYYINHDDYTYTDLIAIPKTQINSVSAFSISTHNLVDKNMSKRNESSYFIKNYVKN
ncbi:hypothetical protein [Vreelandella sulfidaeris]